VEGKGNYIELEKEKVEEGTSDLEDEIWHDKEPSKIWPDEEPIKLLKNKKGSLGLGELIRRHHPSNLHRRVRTASVLFGTAGASQQKGRVDCLRFNSACIACFVSDLPGANMTYGGEIRVVFETPSNFAIFRFDGVKLYRHRPDTIRVSDHFLCFLLKWLFVHVVYVIDLFFLC